MNTTTALQTFDFHTNAVRVHVEGEHVEYCAKDIAAALGYKDTTNAIKQHCRGVVNRHPILDSLGRTQEAVFIGEGDVYRLIASSKRPAAVEFEHWLFDEVLPSIRRHVRHALAGVCALVIMVLMVCGPGACRHPLLYVLGWLVYIPLGVFACIPLIDRIGVAVDRMEEAELHG